MLPQQDISKITFEVDHYDPFQSLVKYIGPVVDI